ncbi:MAG: hypothetical protein V2I82_09900 [Halieaceae bacterium]|jgi:hypothetical protein|nr:hypothetical protein [Halieaceae bacterium]
MPAFILLATMLITAGATALGMYLLGSDPSEDRIRCVEAMTEALKPQTVEGVQDIVRQCKERFAE